MGKATQDLLNEHEAILHVFSILDKMLIATDADEERDLNFADELVHFLTVFADQCHHSVAKAEEAWRLQKVFVLLVWL